MRGATTTNLIFSLYDVCCFLDDQRLPVGKIRGETSAKSGKFTAPHGQEFPVGKVRGLVCVRERYGNVRQQYGNLRQ